MTHKRYFLLLLVLFIPVAIWAAINPIDWALENVLVVVFLNLQASFLCAKIF